MRLINCNFDTWRKNHEDTHKDIIFRAIHPYPIISQINFDDGLIGKDQLIQTEFGYNIAQILNIELQANGRYRATFNITTNPKSNKAKWEHKQWDERFQIIYEKDFTFVTLFTKNEDSSKQCLKNFYREEFTKIEKYKSRQISNLLLKSLVIEMSDKLIGNGIIEKEFENLVPGIRNIKIPKSFREGALKKRKIFPTYSQERDLWVFVTYSEERAHMLAYFNCMQCQKLIIVYSNPTFTKHFRCKVENVYIFSLFEFQHRITKSIYGYYYEQITYLQNHMNITEKVDLNELEEEIENPKKGEYEISKSELQEAFSIMKTVPNNNNEFFLYLSAMNLLNSWSTRVKKQKNELNLFGNMHYFKGYISDSITYLITKHSDLFNSKIYFEKTLMMVEINDFIFSFHHIPLNRVIEDYTNSERNNKIIWKEKKLQPIAPLIYRLAKERLKKAHNKVANDHAS